MNIYPDSSFYVALTYFDDAHHLKAAEVAEAHSKDKFLWSPWHRVEVSNTIRQLACGSPPAIREAEARQLIHAVETDVRVGYFLHMEADWRDVLRTAYEISTAYGFSLCCRSADLLHIAYAVELAADGFLSFDNDQVKVARARGLRIV